jgi:hypothetical protein
VTWPPAYEDVSPGAEELPLLSYSRVAVVRSEKLIAEARDSSETQKKRNVLVGSRYQATANKKLRRLYVCCGYSHLWSV